MIALEYEMSYAEMIDGPLGPTTGSPAGELILMRYDVGLIRSSERFLSALAAGEATEFGDQYMRMAQVFEVGDGPHQWLRENLFVAEGRLTGAKAIAWPPQRRPWRPNARRARRLYGRS